MFDAIKVEFDNGLVVVRFNKPAMRNPLSLAVLERLDEIMDGCLVNNGITAVIFTGTSDVFASGADLREIADVTRETAVEFARRGQDLMAKIAFLPKRTIAAINGFCFGGALDLALACDKRVASPNAKFAHPGTGLGIITGWGGTQRLPRLIGQARAFEMFFTASPVDADRAFWIGLVDAIDDDPLTWALSNSAG
jgi:enoyl-CoA hydratase